MPQKIAVLVSGTGSLLEAIVPKVPVHLVLADRPCRGIDEVAVKAELPGVMVPWVGSGKTMNEDERDVYTLQVLNVLYQHGITLVVMAGFMTIFGRGMFYGERRFAGRILNTHPSLLPSFKGHHAVRDALAYGVKLTGCTIHVATEELDAGPIIAQEAVPVRHGDTEATLHERIKQVERVLYPRTILEYATRLEYGDSMEELGAA